MPIKLEVLLRENLKDLGKCGDVVRVAPGYARNFLFPRRLATEASDENKRLMARRRIRIDAEEVKRNAEIDQRVTRLAGAVVSTSGKADEGGHLFGSVSAAKIAELLHAAGHGAVTEKDVRLEAPLKAVGTHTVKVHVFGDRYADVRVTIAAEASA